MKKENNKKPNDKAFVYFRRKADEEIILGEE